MTNTFSRSLLVAILTTLPVTDAATARSKTNVSETPALIASTFLAPNQREDSELREKDEIRKTFALSPGARVEVSSIRGSVEIETANIEVAEVHIVRSARSRADLEQFKIDIESTPQSLVIRGQQGRRNSGSGYGPDVRHQVTLKLPRRVELSVRSISGHVRIGDLEGQLVVSSVSGSLRVGAVDGRVQVNSVSGSVSVGAVNGQVQVSSVSGDVDIGQVNQPVEIKSVSGSVKVGQAVDFLDVSSVSGALSAGISKLGERGVKINSVSGSVELRFTDELNAQLSTNSISGKVSIEVPNVTMQSEPGASAIRALIGKGGPPISINGVSGGVRLVRGD
jgi:putative adhesin